MILKYFLIPIVITVIAAGLVFKRNHERHPVQDEVNTAQQTADDALMQVKLYAGRASLNPLPLEWKKSVDLLSSCGVDWSIVDVGSSVVSKDLTVYQGPAKAWHGAMRASVAEHLVVCSSYLYNHADAVIDQVMITPTGSVITFSILGTDKQ